MDIKDILSSNENNKLEVKEAIGGLPNSIWETYSSFANTNGGIIALGISEDTNKNLYTSGLTKKQCKNLEDEFWNTIHSDKVSINLLTDKNVYIQEYNNNYVLIIEVPKATRFDKPIYINNNINNSYRRNNTGDYRCTKAEIAAMIRDSDTSAHDGIIVKQFDINILNKETIASYRRRFIAYKGVEHPFSNEPDELFLRHIGAIVYDENNILRPTRAGLLMFGNDSSITQEFPNYFLDYQDLRNLAPNMRWSNRIYSSSGNWSGNIYDFFFRINNKLIEDLKVPFKLEGFSRIDLTPMQSAVREALCNCLTNADYLNTHAVVIKQYKNKLEFRNPGVFAMNINLALQGGDSDSRNKIIHTMFTNINIGERTGSGIPSIIKACKDDNYAQPEFTDNTNPDYTLVTIYLDDKKDLIIQEPKSEHSSQKVNIQEQKSEHSNQKVNIQEPKSEHSSQKVNIQAKK